MKTGNRNAGFTMIELMFVLVVMGFMLAVITPRAYRANIDSKYGALRQQCVELASYANEWANQGIASQQTTSTSTIDSYMRSIAGQLPGSAAFPDSEWIAIAGTGSSSNWNSSAASLHGIIGRVSDTITYNYANHPPESSIQELIPLTRIPINPFNGVNVFQSPTNNPASGTNGHHVTGAIACGGVDEDTTAADTEGWNYYALVFQGTDSSGNIPSPPTGVFYAGQDTNTLAGLRNGIFLARER